MTRELKLPIEISAVLEKYLIFDIEAVSWLRRHHQICGVFIGSLPQNPSQNVFMGLPVEIMPEEAQLLVDKGICMIIDDAKNHDLVLRNADRTRQTKYIAELTDQASQFSAARAMEKDHDRRQKMKKGKSGKIEAVKSEDSVDRALDTPGVDEEHAQSLRNTNETSVELNGHTDSLFDSQASTEAKQNEASTQQEHTITPTTSTTLLASEPVQEPQAVKTLPNSYPLYRHLHEKSYYMTPGLRFGANYSVYPGDPLRFHSHFLATGVQWEEEIDLMDIVGGGRLGTGVKKAWLIGGQQPAANQPSEQPFPSLEQVLSTKASSTERDVSDETLSKGSLSNSVRTFSIEWAGM